MDLETIEKRGQRTTFREMMPEREGVTEVVRPSGKRNSQDQLRRRPLPEYRLNGTETRCLQTIISGIGP